MRRALADALGGAGGVITVDGATGMGKSRLVHEALDAATGTRVPVGSSSGPSPTVRRAPTGCCATRCAPSSG